MSDLLQGWESESTAPPEPRSRMTVRVLVAVLALVVLGVIAGLAGPPLVRSIFTVQSSADRFVERAADVELPEGLTVESVSLVDGSETDDLPEHTIYLSADRTVAPEALVEAWGLLAPVAEEAHLVGPYSIVYLEAEPGTVNVRVQPAR
ncbi:hypothetical protein [Salana multivorans]